jgi:tetrahydromethanopterin S-methyltransferase subunit E
MRAYVTTTGVVFGLLVLVHFWRAVVEDFKPFTEPAFVLITLFALGLSAWSVYLLRRTS